MSASFDFSPGSSHSCHSSNVYHAIQNFSVTLVFDSSRKANCVVKRRIHMSSNAVVALAITFDNPPECHACPQLFSYSRGSLRGNPKKMRRQCRKQCKWMLLLICERGYPAIITHAMVQHTCSPSMPQNKEEIHVRMLDHKFKERKEIPRMKQIRIRLVDGHLVLHLAGHDLAHVHHP